MCDQYNIQDDGIGMAERFAGLNAQATPCLCFCNVQYSDTARKYQNGTNNPTIRDY